MRVKQGNRLTPRLATVDIIFLRSQCEMLKTQCALHSSTLECIWRISFCTAWPIQNQENGIWRKRNDHFLTTLGKSLDMLVDLRKKSHAQTAWKHLFSTLPQALGKFFKDGTSDGVTMPPLEASRPLPAVLVGSSMGFVFWAKVIGFHFFNTFQCGVKLLGPCDHKAVVNNMCKPSNIFCCHNTNQMLA